MNLAQLRNGVTVEEFEQWLEAGKRAQREFIAKCHADPEWIEMAERFGVFPGLKAKPILTIVPANPVDRAQWAEEKAKTQGWTAYQ